MTRRIAIIQGHPDPAGRHLLHAMADAYAEGATVAGHEVRRIEVAKLELVTSCDRSEPVLVTSCVTIR